MVTCSDLKNWDQMTPDERVDMLGELANDALVAWGFEGVGVGQNHTAGEAGDYDPATLTTNFNPDEVGADDFGYGDGASLAMHEAIHAAQHQAAFGVSEFAVGLMGGAAAEQMLESCEDKPDSAPPDSPDYPFQSTPDLPWPADYPIRVFDPAFD